MESLSFAFPPRSDSDQVPATTVYLRLSALDLWLEPAVDRF